ncbi:Glutathione S-transferase [hydrothermal vent metagenome]|uniref:Glutathione S-transferase n=1 Tax=hydrothermal vent metagenome TaxID=652676 RepID=A0A3B1A1M6_9ZZZZ
MKLYYAPAACSMATHIVLNEAGLKFELDKVDLANKVTESGEDFSKINSNGYVPALTLDNGEILTEAALTLQYIADRIPQSSLIPKAGTMERYRLLEWLNFISTELHKTLGPLFNPNITPEWKENQITIFSKRSDFLNQQFNGKKFLAGDQFTIADAYLFTILGWTTYHKIDMTAWPKLTDYMERIAMRPAVMKTLKAEGLV